MLEVIIFSLIPIILLVGLSFLLIKTKILNKDSSNIKWSLIFALANLFYISITYFLMATDCNPGNNLCGLGWSFLNLHNGPVGLFISFLNLYRVSEILDFSIVSLITGAIIGLLIKFILSRMKKIS
jgi:hypothetical protein